MASDQPWTIGRLLEWTTDFFKRRGFSSPRLDAEVLLADARGCQRIELYTAFDQLADDSTRDRFRQLVRRRATGEPVAYLVGRREFFSLPLVVTTDVLIPRPETELVVTAALDAIKGYSISGRPVDVVDVGTGSGAIAVSIAKQAANSRLTATDVSSAALEVAKQNAQRLAVDDRVALVLADLLSTLPDTQRFDFLVSNPPYVSETELAELPADVRDHEPHQALLGGPTGVEVIQRLVPQAADRLRSGGAAFIEISPMIERQVTELFDQEPRFAAATVVKDLSGLARVVTAQRK